LRLLGGGESAQHRLRVALRTPDERREASAAARRERQMALPGVARRNAALDQAALSKLRSTRLR
jgi:hypothetical protein